MDKNLIGLLLITIGVIYGSLSLDNIYNLTLGYLVENDWIRVPESVKKEKNILGRKPTIWLYSATLILIGIHILWKL